MVWHGPTAVIKVAYTLDEGYEVVLVRVYIGTTQLRFSATAARLHNIFSTLHAQ